MGREFIEDIVHFAKTGIKTHHHLFADRIDRRVSNLSEFLFKKIGKTALFFRKCGKRSIITHTADCFFTLFEHRLYHLLDDLMGDVEVSLTLYDVVFVKFKVIVVVLSDMFLEIDHILVEPFHVRIGAFEIVVDIFVFKHFSKF